MPNFLKKLKKEAKRIERNVRPGLKKMVQGARHLEQEIRPIVKASIASIAHLARDLEQAVRGPFLKDESELSEDLQESVGRNQAAGTAETRTATGGDEEVVGSPSSGSASGSAAAVLVFSKNATVGTGDVAEAFDVSGNKALSPLGSLQLSGERVDSELEPGANCSSPAPVRANIPGGHGFSLRKP